MKIKELRLKNFRIFEDQTFSFSDRVTVIAGVNGRGKSSVLDAIALMLSRLMPQVTPAKGGQRKLPSSDITINKEELEISINLDLQGFPVTDFSAEFSSWSSPKFSRLLPQVRQQIINEYGYSDNSIGSPPIAVYYTTDRAAYRLPRKLPEARSGMNDGLKVAYNGALLNRVIDYKDFMARYRKSITLSEEWEEGQPPRNMPGISDFRMQGNNPHFIGYRAVEAIQRCIHEFLPNFGTLNVEEDPLRLTIVKDSGNGELEGFDLGQLSDGERSIIAMLLDLSKRLAIANQNISNPLEGHGIVLIDEIELHLHPKWQREIIEKFRNIFPNIQFIMTTHSPFVIQSLRSDSELILLNGQSLAQLGNNGIEEISKAMGVERPDVSQRYKDQVQLAKTYLQLLDEAALAPEDKLSAYKERLSQSIEHAENPALQAFLEMKRAARLGEE